MREDTDEQPNGEVHRMRVWRGPKHRQELLSPWSWGASPCWHTMCSPTRKLSLNPTLLGFLEASSCSREWSLTQFLIPLPLPEDGVESDWKFQVSNHGLVFLVTSSHPDAIKKPTKSHLICTKCTLVTQGIPRGLGALCQEPGSKTKY